MNGSEQEQPSEIVPLVEWYVSNEEDIVDELEWHKIVSKPHVLSGLRRLAAEARQQIVPERKTVEENPKKKASP